MSAHYRHTQPGWVVVAVLAVVVFVVAISLPREAMGAAAFVPFALLGLVLLLFLALTVEVDLEALRVWFGPGVIRKRIPLAELRSWRAVRNPWYCGWGIRLGPRGVLWNVSGFDAVELDLPGGRHFRIGTDEPEALVRAINQAKGVSASPPAEDGPGDAAGPKLSARSALVIAAAVALGLAALGVLVYRQAQPVAVRISSDGIAIDTPLYATVLPALGIAAISLEPRLPRIEARTNGFSGAGALRGHFRLTGLGDGRLYVELGHPPYLLVRMRQSFVFVNFPEPERTRALYDEAARQWPERAAEPRP
jgi:protein-S-isoprenylcysteine O-methyltransferase Ste14